VKKSQVIKLTSNYVKDKLDGEGSGHDWWHISRVWHMAKHIGQKEKADLYVVELASLLHDIADWKFHHGDDNAGPIKASAWLKSINVDQKTIDHISDIIKTLSFKGAGVDDSMKTLEGKVVQDADRLDAMGAIGIARCFAYGGYKQNEVFDPEVKPTLHQTSESFKNNHSTSINHFYEKLLLLKDRINTKTAQPIAQERHRYMEQYLTRFFQEVDNNK
jgi:uncharacterized protein